VCARSWMALLAERVKGVAKRSGRRPRAAPLTRVAIMELNAHTLHDDRCRRPGFFLCGRRPRFGHCPRGPEGARRVWLFGLCRRAPRDPAPGNAHPRCRRRRLRVLALPGDGRDGPPRDHLATKISGSFDIGRVAALPSRVGGRSAARGGFGGRVPRLIAAAMHCPRRPPRIRPRRVRPPAQPRRREREARAARMVAGGCGPFFLRATTGKRRLLCIAGYRLGVSIVLG
jgi:hypothetical protein